ELTLAVALLVGTGLMVRSVARLLDVSPGFDAARVLTFRLAPSQVTPASGESEEQFIARFLAQREQVGVFYDALIGRLRALPGAEAAGAVNRIPLAGRWWSTGIRIAGREAGRPAPSVTSRVVTPGYFQTLAVPLRSGRDFRATDGASAA